VNLAKQMHIGHLRAVIIGDAIARLFERLGHNAVRQNHVGDWGLPIAMVTAKLKQLSDAGKINLATLTLDSMEKLYKQAQLECAAEERGLAMARKYRMGPKAIAELEAQVEGAKEAMAHAKQTLVKLQAHEPGVFAIWQRISDITMQACLDTCAALHANVKPEHSAGESSYALELGPVVEDLTSRGIAEVSEGALIVRVEGSKSRASSGRATAAISTRPPMSPRSNAACRSSAARASSTASMPASRCTSSRSSAPPTGPDTTSTSPPRSPQDGPRRLRHGARR
jgi:arginyl-tRNA synthetase